VHLFFSMEIVFDFTGCHGEFRGGSREGFGRGGRKFLRDEIRQPAREPGGATENPGHDELCEERSYERGGVGDGHPGWRHAREFGDAVKDLGDGYVLVAQDCRPPGVRRRPDHNPWFLRTNPRRRSLH